MAKPAFDLNFTILSTSLALLPPISTSTFFPFCKSPDDNMCCEECGLCEQDLLFFFIPMLCSLCLYFHKLLLGVHYVPGAVLGFRDSPDKIPGYLSSRSSDWHPKKKATGKKCYEQIHKSNEFCLRKWGSLQEGLTFDLSLEGHFREREQSGQRLKK